MRRANAGLAANWIPSGTAAVRKRLPSAVHFIG